MLFWDDEELQKYFKTYHSNQLANISNFKDRFAVISRINACLIRVGSHLHNTKPVMVAQLFFRAKYAFMTGSGLAMAGQVVESFPVLRLSLECCGYALLMKQEPGLEKIFIGRHDDHGSKKIMKKKFTIRNVADTIGKFDKRLAEIYEQFYDRSIDFGAHPNPNALFGAMTYKPGEEETKVGQLLMSTDMVAVEHAIKSAAQIGLCILFIFQHIFEAKFELLGIHEEMENLRRQHL